MCGGAARLTLILRRVAQEVATSDHQVPQHGDLCAQQTAPRSGHTMRRSHHAQRQRVGRADVVGEDRVVGWKQALGRLLFQRDAAAPEQSQYVDMAAEGSEVPKRLSRGDGLSTPHLERRAGTG